MLRIFDPYRHAWVLAFITLFLQLSSLNGQITNDFTADNEGWYTWNNGAGGTPYLFYGATGGNPGGYVYATDTSSGVWYFLGNSDFKNDLSAYNGCYLLYDVKIPTINYIIPTAYSEVIIQRNDGNTLEYNGTTPTPNIWVSYSILLTGAGWTWNSPAGSVATDADMLSTLTSVKKIKIRAEFSGLDSEKDRLDNVVMTCDLVMLPVEISSFDLVDEGNRTAAITWRTESEFSCEGFIIEKSTNGFIFDSIGYVQGQGTSVSATDYAFYDNYFVANAYYRLREHKSTGRNFLGEVKHLHCKTDVELFTDIYPNPADNYVYLVSNSPESVIYYDVCGLNGLIYKSSVVSSNSGVWQSKIDVSDLPSGLYIANFYMDGRKESKLFEIQH